MSAYNLNGSLPGLLGEGAPSMAGESGRKPGLSQPARAESGAPSLSTVLRSSRVRAWIPPHLIDSLNDRS